MADAEFKVVEADGRKGIAVGTAADFGVLVPDSTFDVNDVKRREEYLLRSHKQGVFLIGATDMAVENAVWDFLYRLGYRQFFPGKNWEVIPRIKHLSVCLDVREKPDYLARDIWYGHGPWDYHLRLGASPCIGTGTNLAELADTDLDGNPRIVPDNGRVDMGCYEIPEPSGSVILIK